MAAIGIATGIATGLVMALLLAQKSIAPPAVAPKPMPAAPPPSHATASAQLEHSAPGAELFTRTNVLPFLLEIDAESVQSLRDNPRESVRATLRSGSAVYSDVAVHIKGSQGSLQSIDAKPALTVSFNKFVPGRKFHGLRKIHFNNTAEDPSFLMEILCSDLCRRAGLPAARSTYGTLKLNGRNLGLYVVKEGLTKEFLGQYFEDTTGNLYDGGFRRDINRALERIGGKGPDEQADRAALLAAAREPDPQRRWERLQEVLDTDRFITLLALTSIMWNWDGYPMARNNYRIYHDPKTGKMVFIPHGLDQMFWEANGTIYPPMRGIVASAVMAIPEARQLYLQRLAELHQDVFNVAELHRQADALMALIRPYKKDALSHGLQLKRQIAVRWESIGRQVSTSE